jgi:hypothetical protein
MSCISKRIDTRQCAKRFNAASVAQRSVYRSSKGPDLICTFLGNLFESHSEIVRHNCVRNDRTYSASETLDGAYVNLTKARSDWSTHASHTIHCQTHTHTHIPLPHHGTNDIAGTLGGRRRHCDCDCDDDDSTPWRTTTVAKAATTSATWIAKQQQHDEHSTAAPPPRQHYRIAVDQCRYQSTHSH